MILLSKKRTSLYLAGALVAFLLATFGFSMYDTSIISCDDESTPSKCYGRKISAMLEKKGTAETLKYIEEHVAPKGGYGAVHTLLHLVGEHAYREKGDLSQALLYLEPYGNLSELVTPFGGFDGFFHGAVTQFFASHPNTDTRELLMDVCEKKMDLPEGITLETFECYHAVGHALMYLLNDHVDRALSVCNSLDNANKKRGCYNGIFMEYAFLYWSEYHPENIRPDNLGDSMTPLCRSLTDTTQIQQCEEFIGSSYFARKANDIRGSFETCKLAQVNYAGCLDRLSTIIIPALFDGNKTSMLDACNEAKPEFVERCKINVMQGIRLGEFIKKSALEGH